MNYLLKGSDKSIFDHFKYLPSISIVIPSFNQGKYLEETIVSILNQLYPKVEIIIIDGGSTDNSIDIIKKYESSIYYWISEKDDGQSHAINKGIEKANGDFIGWQNSDDLYMELAFYNFVREFNKYPNFQIYFGHQAIIDSNSKVLFINYFSPFNLNHFVHLGWNITNQTTFFKKEVLKSHLLDENLHYAMDLDLYSRLGREKLKFKLINSPIGALREYAETKSQTYSTSIILKERTYVLHKYFDIKGTNWTLNIILKIRYLFYLFIQSNLLNFIFRIFRIKIQKLLSATVLFIEFFELIHFL